MNTNATSEPAVPAQRMWPARVLQVRLLDTWHVGSGRGKGQHLDAVVDRDNEALPFVPGRMLRGLLRDGAEMLVAWGTPGAAGQPIATPELVMRVFGGLAPRPARGSDSAATARSISSPGVLSVSDARLPAEDRRVLAGDARLRRGLFMESFQTALDPDRGVAKPGSLRGIELCIPMTLEAEVAVHASDPVVGRRAWDLLDAALPLVLAVGAMKTRGHGRVALSWARAETAANGPGGGRA